jgi:uncharacterized protein
MKLGSALYVGSVMHRRLSPRIHRFRYNGFWLLLDLAELDRLPARLKVFAHNRFNLFSLNDRDHGDGSDTPLRTQIELLLRQHNIAFSGGSIRLLCMPRLLGHSFNPLSIYFCAHPDKTPAAIVYEVHNTFGERHSYVLASNVPQSCDKAFYVSPFMNLDMRYDFSVYQSDATITIAIRVSEHGKPLMIACLAARRRPLTTRSLLRVLLTMPAATIKVLPAVHWEALRLWIKGVSLVKKPASPTRSNP